MSPRRLVVAFRWHSVETEPLRYLAAAERVSRRCSRIGGRSISWSADRYAFDFDAESFRLVLKTVVELLSEANTHAAGIAFRELFSDEAARHWGPSLVVAEALAGKAAAGEVLLDPEIAEVQLNLLVTLGTIAVRVGDQRIAAVLLLPGSCPADGFSLESAQTRASVLDSPTAPASVSVAPSGGRVPSLKAPSIPLLREALAAQERPSVVEALRSRDPVLMTRLVNELRESGGHEVLASRLEAMATLARGDIRTGLSLLESAAQAARINGLDEECQAVLAYAVGLSQVGRSEQALLQALRGLSSARRRGDAQGERAAAQLVGQLAQAAGEPSVAEHWLGLVAR
ncbi:MAG: hypothetical protein RJA70_1855 [Pseudomonadota bacterium]|jgi:hypothetical protein